MSMFLFRSMITSAMLVMLFMVSGVHVLDAEPDWLASDGALAGKRHRVVVSTDIGGTDPDDFQSMVHLLLYSDLIELEGIISSPYGPGRKEDILRVIDHYGEDYQKLRAHSRDYPSPQALRSLSFQGATDVAPRQGFRESTEGSSHIIQCALSDDERPLHVLVWGGLEDLAQALHDAPEILPELRVYWIGGPNKKWSPDAFQYIVDHHPGLWIIEANSTYRGWFTGSDDAGPWSNSGFVKSHVEGHGVLGDFLAGQLNGEMKMGDTPSLAWLLNGSPTDPSEPGWGGQFVRTTKRPMLKLRRLPQRGDTIEVFGILELSIDAFSQFSGSPHARLMVENQSLAGTFDEAGSVHFRFSPKAEKVYRFTLESNIPELGGLMGEITATAPTAPSESQKITASTKHPDWWTDNPDPGMAIGAHHGARSVSQWRSAFLKDFAARMDRCVEH